jgi:PAS domain S-box-containing protein
MSCRKPTRPARPTTEDLVRPAAGPDRGNPQGTGDLAEELGESEQRFHTLFEQSPDAMFINTEAGQFVAVNTQACCSLGYARDELIRLSVADVDCGLWGTDRGADAVERALAGELVLSESVHRRKNGTTFPVEMHLRGITLRGERCLVATARDLSEWQAGLEALRTSEERYRALIENTLQGVMLFSGDRILFANHAAEKILGYPVVELVSGDLASKIDLLHPNDLPAIAARYRNTRAGDDVTGNHELRVRTAMGQFRWLRVEVKQHAEHEGELRFQVFFQDIDARRVAEKALDAERHKLRALAAEVALAEERERRRIAEGLHDHVVQNLAAVRMRLTALAGGTTPAALGELDRLCASAIDATRSLSFELSPPVLYDLGLAAALGWLSEHISKLFDVTIDFRDETDGLKLGTDTAVMLFQCAREILLNAAKHACANTIGVHLSGDDRGVSITVVDDGIGFDAAESTRKLRGFGLFSVRQRVEGRGGTIEVESRDGRGTRVLLRLPVDPRNRGQRTR